MSLSIVVEKQDETDEWCLYAFGAPSEPVGRVRLRKESGDVEILDLDAPDSDPGRPFYLAHLVPHLHTYHDRGHYPDRDRWTV